MYRLTLFWFAVTIVAYLVGRYRRTHKRPHAGDL